MQRWSKAAVHQLLDTHNGSTRAAALALGYSKQAVQDLVRRFGLRDVAAQLRQSRPRLSRPKRLHSFRGKAHTVEQLALLAGVNPSTMAHRLREMTVEAAVEFGRKPHVWKRGERHNSLTFLRHTSPRRGEFQCDCGSPPKILQLGNVLQEKTKSCGCLLRKQASRRMVNHRITKDGRAITVLERARGGKGGRRRFRCVCDTCKHEAWSFTPSQFRCLCTGNGRVGPGGARRPRTFEEGQQVGDSVIASCPSTAQGKYAVRCPCSATMLLAGATIRRRVAAGRMKCKRCLAQGPVRSRSTIARPANMDARAWARYRRWGDRPAEASTLHGQLRLPRGTVKNWIRRGIAVRDLPMRVDLFGATIDTADLLLFSNRSPREVVLDLLAGRPAEDAAFRRS